MDKGSIIVLVIILICIGVGVGLTVYFILKIRNKETGKSCGKKAKIVGLCCDSMFTKQERDDILKPMETPNPEKLIDASINDIYKFLLSGLLNIYRKSTKPLESLYSGKDDTYKVLSTGGKQNYDVYVYRRVRPDKSIQCFLFAPEIKSNYDDLINAAIKSKHDEIPKYISEIILLLNKRIIEFFNITKDVTTAYIYLMGEGDASSIISSIKEQYLDDYDNVKTFGFVVGAIPVLVPSTFTETTLSKFNNDIVYIYDTKDPYFNIYTTNSLITNNPFGTNSLYKIIKPDLPLVCAADYHDMVYYSKFTIEKK
jgi:hypothetical protein